MMKINTLWIRELFTEHYWSSTSNPFRPPVDKYARHAFIEDEYLAKTLESPAKGKCREKSFLISTGSPRKKVHLHVPANICGGKRVLRN